MTIKKTPFVLTFAVLAVLSFVLGATVWPGNGWCIAGVAVFALLSWAFSRTEIKLYFRTFQEKQPFSNYTALLEHEAHSRAKEIQSTRAFVELLYPVNYSFVPSKAVMEFSRNRGPKALQYWFEWPAPYGNQSLITLARRVSGKDDLLMEDALSVFFTTEAVTVLHRLPNQYWFWQVIKHAAMMHASTDFSTKIDVRVLRRVVETFRDTLKEVHEIDLNSESYHRDNSILAYWQAVGIVLLDLRDMSLVRNPIYAPRSSFNLFD